MREREGERTLHQFSRTLFHFLIAYRDKLSWPTATFEDVFQGSKFRRQNHYALPRDEVFLVLFRKLGKWKVEGHCHRLSLLGIVSGYCDRWLLLVDDDANEPLWFFYRLGSKDAGFTYVEANGLFGWKKRDDKWDDIVRLFSFNEI